MSSSLGTLFKISTFGESHGKGVGVVVDGCPANLALSEADIQVQLDRRRPGQNALTTPRDELDQVTILSGVEAGVTLGTPIGLLVANQDQRPGDYNNTTAVPRPSHADYTYQLKYGNRASSGGGRSSARETIGRVASGAIAEKFLRQACGIDIVAWVSAIGTVESAEVDMERVSRAEIDRSLVRCPEPKSSAAMEEQVRLALADKDSVGGIITCVCRQVPAGLGEPVFDKLQARLGQAMLSLPACKGFDLGSGFAGTRMRGSQHNDPFVQKGDRLGTASNYSGGVQGGISNGEAIYFRVAFKPPATIGLTQQTADFDGNPVDFAAKGRHDPCVVARAVPIVESMAALVLADLFLQQKMRW